MKVRYIIQERRIEKAPVKGVAERDSVICSRDDVSNKIPMIIYQTVCCVWSNGTSLGVVTV